MTGIPSHRAAAMIPPTPLPPRGAFSSSELAATAAYLQTPWGPSNMTSKKVEKELSPRGVDEELCLVTEATTHYLSAGQKNSSSTDAHRNTTATDLKTMTVMMIHSHEDHTSEEEIGGGTKSSLRLQDKNKGAKPKRPSGRRRQKSNSSSSDGESSDCSLKALARERSEQRQNRRRKSHKSNTS
jgi:hypothetical protein